jgi:hypothetical protein
MLTRCTAAAMRSQRTGWPCMTTTARWPSWKPRRRGVDEAYLDPMLALAGLADRAGARDLRIAWTCPHTPGEPDGHHCPDITWDARASYQGARVQTDGHRTPNGAAIDLAERLLTGGTCRCGRPVALADGAGGCRWRLMGQRWQPGCDADPITVDGTRGDLAAMHAAAVHAGTRRERRAEDRKRGGRRG